MPPTPFADNSIPARHNRRTGSAKLPLVLALLLLLGIALRLGSGVAALLAPPESNIVSPAGAGLAGTQMQADSAVLDKLNLFSEASATATAAASPAPPTRGSSQTQLNLRLEGVILASPPENSLAIIVSSAQQGSYRSGQGLPAGEEVRLESIHADHVVVSNRGQRETLWLYAGKDVAGDEPATAGQTPGGLPASLRSAANDLVSPDAAVSRAAAASLAEVISVSPAQENGSLVGYRLMPGARVKDFVQLGFRTNDVVTAVNGIPLNDMANLPQLYNLMNEAADLSFSLLREGEPVNLQVSLAAP